MCIGNIISELVVHNPLASIPILAVMLVALFSLAACSSQPRKVDTRQWTPISCSTFLHPGNTCYQEAHAVCPQGYDIYNAVYSHAEQRRKMEIACKP